MSHKRTAPGAGRPSTTLEADGVGNNDGIEITGASPSPVALAGGAKPGPYFATFEQRVNHWPVAATIATGTPHCISFTYTPTVAQTARLDGHLAVLQTTGFDYFFSTHIVSSINGGSTRNGTNGSFLWATVPDGLYGNPAISSYKILQPGISYTFAIIPSGSSAFATQSVRCNLTLQITDN